MLGNVSEYQASVLQLKVDKLRLVEVCGTSESEFSCVSDIVFLFIFLILECSSTDLEFVDYSNRSPPP